jgi:aminopeptidase 2
LNNYLKKYQYKNATTNDLFNELELASKKEIKNLMQVWTRKTGYPVVNVCHSYNNFYILIKKLTDIIM